MRASRVGTLFVFGIFTFLLISMACSSSNPTATAAPSDQGATRNTESASYSITLEIGPVVTMLTSDQGMRVMGRMTGMTFTDEGQAVNHHLEVHVVDKSSGARVADTIPTVNITDQATGVSRQFAANVHSSGEVPYLLACMTTNHRESERHFGDNLYLPDGKYTITVGLGNETAVSEDILVSS